MKRKDYQKPAMRVVKLQHRGQILTGSEVKSMHSNAGLGLGGSDKDYYEDDDDDDDIR